jgi:hypothetical protein
MIPDILQKGGRGPIPYFLLQDKRIEAAHHGQLNNRELYFRVGIHKQQVSQGARISEPRLDIKRLPKRGFLCPSDR